jgi:outer membrane protein OmpA-like peptidoglycan-associated protein
MFRNLFVAIPIAVLAIGGSTACATKKFVRTSVGEVNDKVDSVGRSLEETQERTRQNEAKITEVDQKAQAAAQAADQKATAAGSAAQQAQNSATQAGTAATAAGSKADAVDKAAKRIMFEVVLSEDEGNFAFGKTALPEEAKAKLDQMITRIKADPKGAFFEIEGHTDNVGDKMYNEKLGMERAEAVKRYLYEQHQIPLHKMNVISYGEEKPVAPNKDKAGRAQNRRVVIKILA